MPLPIALVSTALSAGSSGASIGRSKTWQDWAWALGSVAVILLLNEQAKQARALVIPTPPTIAPKFFL